LAERPAVRRVESIHDLPDASIACSALGRHIGFGHEDPIIRKADGWINADAQYVEYHCGCTRWRYEVIDANTGERLTPVPVYGGGYLLWSKVSLTRAEARVEYIRRVRARQAGVTDVSSKRRDRRNG
jgi:hypothetical protein